MNSSRKFSFVISLDLSVNDDFSSNTIENTKVPKKLKKSFEQGLEYNKNQKEDFKKCYKNYPICPYSAETMLKLISFNKLLFG